VVTVCDLAREELGGLAAVHWSVADPAREGTPAVFDAAVAELDSRVAKARPARDRLLSEPGVRRRGPLVIVVG
jgi:hypothetical protein